MVLFASPEFEAAGLALQQRLPQVGIGQYKAGRIDNGEFRINVETPVKDEQCSQPTSTPLLDHAVAFPRA